MRGMNFPTVIHFEVVLVTICTRTSVKIASELHFTAVAVAVAVADGPSTAICLFRPCSTIATIIATDVKVLVVVTKRRPGTKDIVAF